MAIYSLNHKPVGKSTQDRPYTTGAHVNYITREKALGHLDGNRLPVDRDGARDFFNHAEDNSRKNGRVADKLMLATPKELTPEQRHELVRGYAEEVTGGRAPWLAAHHDQGKDANNPHCHLVFRDRDPETGKRVFGTSEKGSTQRLRDLWQEHSNRALERAGRPERIDARSLKAQGIDREPQVHEGPRNRAAADRGRTRPESKPRNFRNGAGARSPSRRVDYPAIDNGRTRQDYNRQLPHRQPTERDHWNDLDAARQRDELDDLKRIHKPPDGRRDDAGGRGDPAGRQGAEPPRSFNDKLAAFRAEKPDRQPVPDKDTGGPALSPSQPTKALPFSQALQNREGRPPDRSPIRPARRGRDDERER